MPLGEADKFWTQCILIVGCILLFQCGYYISNVALTNNNTFVVVEYSHVLPAPRHFETYRVADIPIKLIGELAIYMKSHNMSINFTYV